MYRPEQFVAALLSLCPTLVPRVDFEVTNDGSGPVITAWFRPDVTQPTQTQIEAVDTDALKVSQAVLPQDLMAQFTTADAALIQAAVTSNVQFWLLWSAMIAQRDPMGTSNVRFLAGWSALIQVLGQPRMDAIAAALNITIAG